MDTKEMWNPIEVPKFMLTVFFIILFKSMKEMGFHKEMDFLEKKILLFYNNKYWVSKIDKVFM